MLLSPRFWAKLFTTRGIEMETAITTENQYSSFFKDFMASMDALGKKQEETARQMAETDRKMAETDRLFKERDWRLDKINQTLQETALLSKETEKKLKELGENIGGLNNTFGKVVEHMVAPKIREKFHEAGLIFQKTSAEIKFEDTTSDILFEVDVMLENSSTAMLVETKAKARIKDVKGHIKRMEKMRAYADLHGDNRTFLGAIAGVVMKKDVRERAFESGFYVLVPSGDSFNILPSPDNFKPREW